VVCDAADQGVRVVEERPDAALAVVVLAGCEHPRRCDADLERRAARQAHRVVLKASTTHKGADADADDHAERDHEEPALGDVGHCAPSGLM
jgi:hypothetical protein